jgi:hypothetical protein
VTGSGLTPLGLTLRSSTPGLPWRRPRHELLLLALVAVATLSPVYTTSTQDLSRLCLTRALVEGHVVLDRRCIGATTDQASFGGRPYSDKAPGLSALALPAAQVTRLPPPGRWTFEGDPHLWAVRVLTSGIAFLVLVFLVGRVSEGLARGCGGAALATFALGTIAGPLAATTFGHVTAGALAFGAFVLAWRGRPGWAGLAAAAAVTVDYPTALIAVVLAVYLAWRGMRALGRYLLGALPAALALAAYDWAAFGSPFHLSYRYVRNGFAAEQNAGFFGVSVPRLHGIRDVFVGELGLLVVSPVLVAGALGLVLLARRYRPEAAVCGGVAVLLVLANCGYFLPYGGISPGPRFLVPALPFLALGFGPAFARRPRLTTVLAIPSVIATTALTLTWASSGNLRYRDTVWGEIVRAAIERGSSRFEHELTKNVLVWAGPDRNVAAAMVCVCVASAFLVAVWQPALSRLRT